MDTPVKRYSSGMYVRLAFAVAAHLEPEILIVDEVLAVGDAQFQKKCMGKMQDVTTGEGRTIIFVTHNMGMITLLCDRGVYLDAGQVVAIAPASEAVTAYYAKGGGPTASKDFTTTRTCVGDDYAQLLECYVKNAAGTISPELDIQDSVIIGLRYKILHEKHFSRAFPYCQLNLYSATGELIFQSMAPRGALKDFSVGEYTAECEIPAHFLNNETYYIGLGMATCEDGVKVHFFENNVLRFQIARAHERIALPDKKWFQWPFQWGAPSRVKMASPASASCVKYLILSCIHAGNSQTWPWPLLPSAQPKSDRRKAGLLGRATGWIRRR